MTRDAALLTDEHAAFLQGGVSIVAASADARRMPSIGRATGCRVAPDRRRVTVYVAAGQAAGLLADVRERGRIAVVFNLPSSHRSMQLKADDARVRPIEAGERALVERYVQAFADEIIPLGHHPQQVRALLVPDDGDVVAIDFTPSAAFDQTPGPKAGTPLASAG